MYMKVLKDFLIWSVFVQGASLLLVMKYSLFFIFLSEIWVFMVYFFMFIPVVGGGYILIFYLSLIFCLGFSVSLIVFLMLGGNNLGGVGVMFYFIFLKQIFFLGIIFFFSEKDLGVGFCFYLINSKFILFLLMMLFHQCPFVKEFLLTMYMEKITFCLLMFGWFVYFFMFSSLLSSQSSCGFLYSFMLFTQYLFFFTIFMEVKYTYFCWGVDLMVLMVVILISLGFGDEGGEVFLFPNFYMYSLYVGIYLSFIFSLPPFPSFYAEVGWFFWVWICFFSSNGSFIGVLVLIFMGGVLSHFYCDLMIWGSFSSDFLFSSSTGGGKSPYYGGGEWLMWVMDLIGIYGSLWVLVFFIL